jgi:hypothetical protein
MPRKRSTRPPATIQPNYDGLVGDIAEMLAAARRASARAVNALMTATYWEIGRRIVEFEQGGAERAEYGSELLESLSTDLSAKFGRGFSRTNLQKYRQFYLAWPEKEICPTQPCKSILGKRPTVSGELITSDNPQIPQTVSGRSGLHTLHEMAARFPLSWSHYVLLLRVRSPEACDFYHTEACEEVGLFAN